MYTFFVSVFLCFISCYSLSAQWTQCNGPFGGEVKAIVISGNYIFAGTVGGIFRSSDNGDNWTTVNSGLAHFYTESLAGNKNTLFLGVESNIYRSTDNGENWKLVNSSNNIDYNPIVSIAINETTVFAVRKDKEVIRSTDNGDSWENVDIDVAPLSINTLIANGSTLFVGATEGGVFRSTDNGENWVKSEYNFQNKSVLSLYIMGKSIFAGVFNKGVFRSTDNGENWIEVNKNINYHSILSLGGNNSSLFAGTQATGIFRSSDQGENWVEINNGMTYPTIYSINIVGQMVYIATKEGVFKSSDDGENWTAINNKLSNQTILALTSNNNSLFAGTQSRGLFRSNDNGKTWTDVTMEPIPVYSLASEDQTVFAGIWNGVLRSTDNGMNFIPIEIEFGQDITSLGVNGDNVFATSSRTKLLRSTDNGENWTRVSSLENPYIIFSILCKKSNVFLSTSNGVFRSTDNGESWKKFDVSLSSVKNNIVQCLTMSNSTLFAGTYEGIFRSTDNGENWKNILSDHNIRNIYFNTTTLFASSDNTLFYSIDDGNSWKQIGLNTSSILSLTIMNNNTIYAGTYGNSVWKLDLNSITSVEEQTNAHNNFDLMLSPNPNNGMLHCTLNSYQDNISSSLEIYSMQGEKVLQQIIEQPSMILDISHIPTGIYYVIAHSGNQSTRQVLSLVK